MKQFNFLSKLSEQVVTRLKPLFTHLSASWCFVSVLCLLLTFGAGSAWADYTITFKTSGSGEKTTKTDIINSGGDYLSACTGSKTYTESNGLRFGTSSAKGNVVCTMTSSGTYIGQIQASKITLKNVLRYGSDASVSVKTTITYTDNTTKEDTYTAPTSAADHDINLTSSKTIKSVKIESTANSKRFYVKSFTVVAAAASHTLSSSVSPTGTGSVSLSAASVEEGKTATATATANRGYVFSSWSISGTGASLSSTSTNPTTVTMGTANATVTANFTQASKASITLSEAGATTTDTTSYYVGEEYTLPSSTSASCGTKVLVGWSTVEVAETNTKPTSNYYEKGAKVTLSASQTFYAVFANTASGYKDTTIVEDFEKQSTGTIYNSIVEKSADESNAGIGWYMYYGTNSTSGALKGSKSAQMRWYKTALSNYPYIKTTTQLLSLSKVKFKAKVGNTDVKMDVSYYTDKGDSWTKVGDAVAFTNTDTITLSYDIPGEDDTNYIIKIGVSSASSAPSGTYYALVVDNVAFTYKTPTTIYTNYTTSCCTDLGSINGSVSWSNAATAVVSWDNLDHVSSWTVKYKTHAAGDYSTWAGEQTVYTKSTTNDSRKVTITGLTPCTDYDFQIIANPASGYCDKNETIEDSQTHNWTVTKTGVTNVTAASLSAIPATTCSGFGPITITAATGYALPAEITVTNASKNWNSSTGALTISSVTGNVTITITPTCVSPVITADPADANYYVGDSPTPLSVTATLASGTLTYLWKVSTDNGDNWSNANGTNNLATYSGASLSASSTGTTKFKCIVGNSEGGCTVESAVATITVSNASYFPNGKTIFIQAHSTSAWTGGGCVMAWFHTSGGSEEAQATSWLFDATDGDAGKKLFATVVPASGNLPYLDIQRFASNCSDWWNKNGGCSYADANGSNTIRSTGKHDDSSDGDYVRWNNTGVTIDLHGDPSGDDWASSLASFSDQGSGVWTATYSNYAPANAAGESQSFKAKTNYNGWIGNKEDNDHQNENATLSGMHVGSTYNITATLNVMSHALTMSKTFVKGEVSFDMQGHGEAISKLTNVTAGSKISAPSEPSATGYTFGGWFTDVECTDEWNFATDEVDETMTLYAKWTVQTYTITKTLTNVANAGLPSSFTYTGATTTALNSTFTVDATNFFLPSTVAVTMGGSTLAAGTDYTYNNSTGAFTFDIVITGDIVITATATAKLQSIAITTQPTTRKYFEGESFSSSGAVVTATMGDGSTKAVTASTTWTPAGALSAGSQTITASYTENGINMTATTTIDVYSVTVNKLEEDEETVISVDGVTATWTVGTKALAAGVGSTKYVFKEWQVTGASIGSTSSANTTLSNPTANVVVNAVFYKPRTVKWSVNGNDNYASETVTYNGTISTVPSNPSGLACAGTFIAWTDAAHNNGTTAKDDDSYYESKLFTDAGDFPNITADTTTFYAVFAEVPDEIYWAMGTIDQLSSGSGYATYDGVHTVTGSDGNDYTYTSSNVMSNSGNQFRGSTYCGRIYNTTSLGRITRIVLDYSAYAGEMKVYESDSEISSSGTTALTPTISSNIYTYECSGKGYFIVIQEGSHAAKANVTVYFGDAPSNYVTQCDANIVKVTYDANGGVTTCTNTTTDKTEDFTVCSTEPTKDYYEFAGWLCSADSKIYDAGATIDDEVITADFTLTAQWNPTSYNITYELYEGTNSGSNPATYNVTTATITLQDPTKGHDRFEGWYSTYSAGVYSDQVTSIPLGSHGDITLHAKWTTRHEIIFDYTESASSGTTTIWRASDENLEAAAEGSLAGQGAKPANPSAPGTCDMKVFVGWVESLIDDETDTEPGDLTNATGTVSGDKHYYATWAIESSTTGPVTVFEDALYGKAANNTTFDTYGDWDSFGYVYGRGTSTEGVRVSSADNAGYLQLKANIGLASVDTIKFKIKSYGDSNGGKITLSSYSGAGTYDNAASAEFTTTNTSSWEEKTCILRNADNTTDIRFEGAGSKYRVYLKDIKITKAGTVYTYSAYSTSCCATKVTLSQNSPEHGTIVFGKASVGTCGGDKDVTLTITPAAGYQLHSYEVATGSGKVTTKTDPGIALDNNSSAAQNITLTFAEDANGAYDVTASFSEMVVTNWSWTNHDGGAALTTDPIEIYVDQQARVDVTYTPAKAELLSTHTAASYYNHDATGSAYVRNPQKASEYFTFYGKASTGDETTVITLTHNDDTSSPKTFPQLIYVKVLPLPLVHFVDLVHGKAFDDVAATIVENALSATKSTPTSDDWTTPNANSCEENHLHLVGWIREDWPALVAYLNGTGDAPLTSAIVGAGNDGEGHAYFLAPGASINVQIFNGKTFYAVWAKME